MNKSLVIVGGGFGGIRAAQLLERTLPSDWTLTLVSQENFITFNPLLAEVVGASVLPGHVIAPHRQMLRKSNVRMAEVTDIDSDQQIVHYLGEGAGEIHYDQLVVACGNNANLDIVPGMAAFALPLKTLGDALFLRNRIIARLEQAELQPDVAHRRWLTSFLIVGGGFSGVETAGALADFVQSSLKYYTCIKADDVRIVLIHSGHRLLPEMSDGLGEFTSRRMSSNGIEILLDARVTHVTDLGVELNGSQHINAGTVICTIGTAPSALLDSIDAPKIHGRLAVNTDLSVMRIPRVWAIGDCAAAINSMDGKLSPPTAQFAEAQATVLAKNILSRLKGQPTKAFHYRAKGQLSSIGHAKAVAEVYGWKFSGFTAWLLWRTLYLVRMPTFSRRARLFLEWTWAMFFPPDLAHFGYRRSDRRHRAAQPPPMPKQTPTPD